MKEAAGFLFFIVVVTVLMGGFAITGATMNNKREAECRKELVAANYSADDIIKLCVKK